jgi:cytochrome c-type biogenesis protein
MDFGPATYALGLLAGALSTFSPCVLPLIPILIASAVSAHRRGPWALGTGLAVSFAIVGILLASIGSSFGLEPDSLRMAGAVVLALFGLILLIPRLQDMFGRATAGLSNSGHQMLARVSIDGLTGQFVIGLLLGVVWSPCVGPTLGAATTLASQGKNLGQITLLMLVFGIGAAAPLLILGSLSRSSLLSIRGRLHSVGQRGKQLFGFAMLSLGLLIVTGFDKPLETSILDHTPDWLTRLTTRF